MIGTGVFTSLGFQVGGLPQPFSILFLWLLGGVVALCGAFSYAELSAALPRSGGEYHLLGRIYHPAAGFLAGWISLTVGFAAPIAAASIAMGNYLTPLLTAGGVIGPESAAFCTTVTAVLVMSAVSLVHLRTLRISSAFQRVFTCLKVLLILVMIAVGFVLGAGHNSGFSPSLSAVRDVFSDQFAVSLVFVMYAYSGWNASTYVAGEVRNPGRNIPLSLFAGTAVVVVLYVLLNAVFIYTTPISMLDMKVEIGLISAQQVFGSAGGAIMGGLIAIGLVSSISSMTWAGPRVSMVMGEDMRLFRLLGARSRYGIPVAAVIAQWIIAMVLVLTSSFEAVLVYIGFTLSLSTFLTVLGVFVLRFRQPALHRPYRTWGYPFTPAFFLLVTGWMLVFVALDKPVESLFGLGTVAAGLVIYYLNAFIFGNVPRGVSVNELD
jgi:APA family basic amino acid/polyamine antiporter